MREIIVLMFALDADQTVQFIHYGFNENGEFSTANMERSVRFTFRNLPFYDTTIETVDIMHDKLTGSMAVKLHVKERGDLERMLMETKGQFKLLVGKSNRSSKLQLSIKQV